MFTVVFKSLRYLFHDSGMCMQRTLVAVYRLFDTAFQSHLQGVFCLPAERKPQQDRGGCLKCRVLISVSCLLDRASLI